MTLSAVVHSIANAIKQARRDGDIDTYKAQYANDLGAMYQRNAVIRAAREANDVAFADFR